MEIQQRTRCSILIGSPIFSCLKLYCQCFALSTTCGPKCRCQSCFNTTQHASEIEEARRTILERNPSAFVDKFRGNPVTPTPGRPPAPPVVYYASPPASAWHHAAYTTPQLHPQVPMSVSNSPGPFSKMPPTNALGCKCRRSFCLKKVCKRGV